MAGKSALPLLAMFGIAAVAFGKKKKKKTESSQDSQFPKWAEKTTGGIGDLEFSPDGQAKMVFDQSCQAFADKLNADAHNTYITGAFHTLVKSGVKSAQEITVAMLRDQAPQCPWDDASKYTDLMRGVHDQLLAAVQEYGAQQGIVLT